MLQFVLFFAIQACEINLFLIVFTFLFFFLNAYYVW